MEAFKDLQYEEGKNLINNYRAIQDTNHRAIIIASNDNRSAAVPTVSIPSSLLSIILATFFAKYLY